jgi:hypothetical protein
MCRGGNRCSGIESASRHGFAVARFFAPFFAHRAGGCNASAGASHALPRTRLLQILVARPHCASSWHIYRTLIAPGKPPVCP